jgi:hypothetical protein
MSNNKTIIFFLLLFPNIVLAQVSISRTASANVNVFSYMSFDVTSNGPLDFKFNNNQQLLDGVTLNNKFNVNVISNINWILNVSTLTSNFLAIGPQASTQMPPDILSIKKNTSNAYIPLNHNPNMVCLGYRGDQTSANNQFKLDIKATPGYTFNGGSYAIVLIFTLSVQ